MLISHIVAWALAFVPLVLVQRDTNLMAVWSLIPVASFDTSPARTTLDFQTQGLDGGGRDQDG